MRGQEQLISAMNWRLNIKMRWIPHCKSRQLCLALMFFFYLWNFSLFFFFFFCNTVENTRNTSKFILSGIFVESLVILWMMMIMMMVMNLFPIEQSSVSNSPPNIIHFLSDDCLGSSSISVVRNRSKSILYMRMVSCFYLSRLIFNLMIKTVGFIVVKCK